MSNRGEDAVDAAAQRVYAAFDQLLRLVEEGALDDLTDAQRLRHAEQLDQLQNRAAFVERLVTAALLRRHLSAAG